MDIIQLCEFLERTQGPVESITTGPVCGYWHVRYFDGDEATVNAYGTSYYLAN
jgi:hypothetical protein